jgi:beta-galactosidase
VEFTPDLLENLKLQVQGKTVGGRFFIQQYQPAGGGKAVGRFEAGDTAAVEHGFGKGRALLIGTFPGAAYFLHHSPDTKAFFASLLDWAGVKQQVRVSVPDVKARLHTGAGGNYLWVVNPTRQARTVTVSLEKGGPSFSRVHDVWDHGAKVKLERGALELTVDERNAAIVRLDP